jgi:hypothetical protein
MCKKYEIKIIYRLYMFIVASYHKAGSVLLSTLFEILNKRENKKLNYKFFYHFCNCKDEDIENNKCIVIIRNPYEMICSGVRYHEKSNESWLHEKKSYFNDKTYYEMIHSLKPDDKIIFEMNNCAKYNIDAMYSAVKNINYKKNVLFIKLEELMDIEKKTEIADKIMNHLSHENLGRHHIIYAITEALKLNHHHKTNTDDLTYMDYFKEMHFNEFRKIFPEDLFQVLGYNIKHSLE